MKCRGQPPMAEFAFARLNVSAWRLPGGGA